MSMNPGKSSGPSPERHGRQVSPKLIVTAVVAVLVLIFVFQNTEQAPIRFLVWDFDIAVWVALLITLLIGFGIGWVVRGGRAKQN
jgi:uncharacterized integral membrane protein